MRAIIVVLFSATLFLADLTPAGAQPAEMALEVFELPRFTQPPDLDGIRGAGEWANTLMLECSPSQMTRDIAQYGEFTPDGFNSNYSPVSANELFPSPGEDASIAGTDADVSALIWHAWDDDGLYYIAEVRDNVRDIGTPEDLSWWARDGLALFVDLLDSDDRNEDFPSQAEFTSVNQISFTAAPQHSSPATVTWRTSVEGNLGRGTQDPELVDGLSYAFRDAEDEFGGEADYTIEGKNAWATLMRFQLPTRPGVATEMGF